MCQRKKHNQEKNIKGERSFRTHIAKTLSTFNSPSSTCEIDNAHSNVADLVHSLLKDVCYGLCSDNRHTFLISVSGAYKVTEGCHFQTENELKARVNEFFAKLDSAWYAQETKNVPFYNKCLDLLDQYIEK